MPRVPRSPRSPAPRAAPTSPQSFLLRRRPRPPPPRPDGRVRPKSGHPRRHPRRRRRRARHRRARAPTRAPRPPFRPRRPDARLDFPQPPTPPPFADPAPFGAPAPGAPALLSLSSSVVAVELASPEIEPATSEPVRFALPLRVNVGVGPRRGSGRLAGGVCSVRPGGVLIRNVWLYRRRVSLLVLLILVLLGLLVLLGFLLGRLRGAHLGGKCPT